MIIPVSPLGLLLGLAGERRLQTAQSKITFRVDRASCAGGSVDSHHHTFGHCALLIWNDSCRCSSLSGLSIQANWSTPGLLCSAPNTGYTGFGTMSTSRPNQGSPFDLAGSCGMLATGYWNRE